MDNLTQLPLKARIYWLMVVAGGILLAAISLFGWRPQTGEMLRLAVYVGAGVLSSGFKVNLPGLLCTLSMNYVFILAGLLDLNLQGGLVIGLCSVMAQVFLRAKQRPKWEQALFNVAAIAFPVEAAHGMMLLHLPYAVDPIAIVPVVGASIAYFTTNTLLLATIIGFTTKKTPLRVWHESYLWTAPQYIVGGLIAGVFHLLIGILGWMGLLCTV